ncbi:Uncharacterised protein [Legionella sainthelensi]|uniref:hypothetical protein n=1 Tax=Legionella sainthelensi TaxID=28087 RepID=UPI000E1FD6AA|nr:hypothetical protein [Legionella sainthelensi]VEB37122.1 Uncharacterised protein [Legionella sainthelensi]
MKDYDKYLSISLLDEQSSILEFFYLEKTKTVEVIKIKFDGLEQMQELDKADKEKIAKLKSSSHLLY